MRVYADTSVIGGCEDHEFREPSRRLMERCSLGEVTLVLSALTLQELERAPQAVRDVLRAVGADNVEVVAITGEIRELADRYVESGVLGKGMRADAQHVAAATVSGVDVLASWNFRHMVNLSRSPAVRRRSPADGVSSGGDSFLAELFDRRVARAGDRG
ncbi:MAG: PIN domain-containing protein [Gammaproteobacteria bacterium]|nr:PIN domain-containing protein [Gammaproteobacteria bacterium]